MTRRKASIYHIASNHSRAIENELQSLAEIAADGGMRGMTYVYSDNHEALELGCVGSHKADKTRTIGVLFRAALALSEAA